MDAELCFGKEGGTFAFAFQIGGKIKFSLIPKESKSGAK